jgi:hypothetical protein
MPLPPRNASNFTDTLKARRARLADLLELLNVNPRKAPKIEKLSIDAIKAMISALDSQLKKRD